MTDDPKKKHHHPKQPATPRSKFSGPPVSDDKAEQIVASDTAPAQSKLTASFNSIGERSRNIFYSRNAQSIHEFHALMGDPENKRGLTKAEVQLLDGIKKEATTEAVKYNLPIEVMESLLLAQKTTGVDHDAYMERVLGPQPKPGEVVSDTNNKAGPIKIDLLNWLNLVKEHGKEHGLGYFADRIKTQAGPNGTTELNVEDPALLREISSLRSNPRLLSMMAGEQMKDEKGGKNPQLAYQGVNNIHDDNVARDQRNLKILGFDIGVNGADGKRGPFTSAAEKEFTALSKQAGFNSDALQAAADKAVADSADFKKRFKVDVSPDQAFAIRNASKEGGADFDLMMKLAQRESNFNSTITAKSNEAQAKKAQGLFQFKPGTWLAMVKRYGDKYGLGEMADHIKVGRTENGTNYEVSDPWLRDHILSLRKDPRISAMMGAEFLKENKEILEGALRREPSKTDQYMAHFLGPGGAVSFLRQLKTTPGASAADAFPKAASTNHGVFYNDDGSERSLQEVYSRIAAGFNTKSYDNTPAPPVAPKKAGPAHPHPHPHPHPNQ
jgi:hypothetical protein